MYDSVFVMKFFIYELKVNLAFLLIHMNISMNDLIIIDWYVFFVVILEMQHTELNKDLVRNRLDYGTYEAAQARDTQGRRPFRSHEVIHKIYLTDGGIEIPNWYQCTRCNEILFCVSRHGTKPLNAHADYKCTELTNEQKEAGRLAHRSRANENHRDPNPMPNAPPNNLIQAANVAPVNSTPATTTTTTSATNPALDTPNEVPASASQAAQLTADELAIALWRATTLGATYGVVPVTTFRRFLDRDQPW